MLCDSEQAVYKIYISTYTFRWWSTIFGSKLNKESIPKIYCYFYNNWTITFNFNVLLFVNSIPLWTHHNHKSTYRFYPKVYIIQIHQYFGYLNFSIILCYISYILIISFKCILGAFVIRFFYFILVQGNRTCTTRYFSIVMQTILYKIAFTVCIHNIYM